MKLALWNINGGGGEPRFAELLATLSAQPAHVLVLNEYVVGTSDPLIEALRAKGWRHTVVSAPPGRWGGVAVCSKLPLTVRPAAAGLEGMAHRCIVAEVGGGADVVLWAVYAPYEGPDVARFWRAVIDGLAGDHERDAIVVGDFNAGIPDSDIPAGGLEGAPFVQELLDAGFEDLWRLRCGQEAREYTWKGRTNLYRIDHAFGSPGAVTRLRACEYNHEVRRLNLSDHSLLQLQLTPRPLARAGSRRWLQIAVNHRNEALDPLILESLPAPADATVEWLSPVEHEGYIEYRDGATADRLELPLPDGALQAFWPAGGPVWDGLARLSTGDVLLVEAKAHIPEMLAGGTRATGDSRERILAALRELQRELAPRAGADWAGRFYQFANRLAHLDFLRRNGVPARLVYVYFVHAPDVPGPKSREEWDGAIRLMEAYLGLGRHRLSRFVHKVFVDVRALAWPDMAEAEFVTQPHGTGPQPGPQSIHERFDWLPSTVTVLPGKESGIPGPNQGEQRGEQQAGGPLGAG